MEECPECRAGREKAERVRFELEKEKIDAQKKRELMKKWDTYIRELPPYRRFIFEVLEDGELCGLHGAADAETESQAREKIERQLELLGPGFSLGQLFYNEPRNKSLLRSNLLREKEHLEKAGIPEYKPSPRPLWTHP